MKNFFSIQRLLNNLKFTIVFFLCITLHAQNPYDEIFYRIGENQGLAQGNVNDIIQDSLGFIWLATENGLYRFDGHNFILFQNDKDDSSSISFNHVFSLLEWQNGIIWVGTLGGGLNKFDTKTEKFQRFQFDENDDSSISSDIIYKVFEDFERNIWISTLGGGLNKFESDKHKFIKFRHSPNNSSTISSDLVSAIYEDKENNLWLGTFDEGLNYFDRNKNKFNHFKKGTSAGKHINHNQVMDILPFSASEILIATFGGGINLLNTETFEFSNYSNTANFSFDVEHRNIRKLFNDGSNIWIGTYNGLFRFEKLTETIQKFNYAHNNPYSIDNNKIREIFKDKGNVIWIGTTNGLNLIDQNRKKFEFIEYSDPHKQLESDLKKLSIPKIKGLVWPKDPQSTKQNNIDFIKYYGNLTNENDKSWNTFLNFYYDANNTLWIADYNGLKYYDYRSKSFNYIEYFANNENDYVKSFYIDSEGNFWAGTLGGGLTYHNKKQNTLKKFIHIENDTTTITDSRVIPILEDSYGTLWIGTYGGLNKFDYTKESFIRYTHNLNDSNSISNNRIYTIFESNNKDLWIGTNRGLNKYIRNTNGFQLIQALGGLSESPIYGILEDDNNCLWLRTNNGIKKYNTINGEVNNYTLSDGLFGIESNLKICFETIGGKLGFGTLNGFNIFQPKKIVDNKTIPSVVFTELRILDSLIEVGNTIYLEKSLNDIDQLTLSYRDKIFSIEFAALNFGIAAKNRYAYMLEGFRDQWTFLDGNNRRATFTNLNAGEYIFHVKASNSDGVWNEVGRSLKIIVTPPYWETWWFQLISVLLFLALIFAIYEFRLQRLIEIERTRARIARNLHDDVGGTLASIQYFVNAIRKNKTNGNQDKFLDLIMASSNDAQEKIRDIIWTVNPREDKLQKFFVKFNRYASDLFDSNGISYSIKFPKVDGEKILSMEKRQHLWCICKETVINTIKHSSCSHVNINFSIKDEMLKYIIEDDGVGFNKEDHVQGNGLTNIDFRVKKMRAKYDVETERNEGVKFSLQLDM